MVCPAGRIGEPHLVAGGEEIVLDGLGHARVKAVAISQAPTSTTCWQLVGMVEITFFLIRCDICNSAISANRELYTEHLSAVLGLQTYCS